MQLELIECLPTNDAKMTPLLFLHGSFHGAWCWKEYFLPYFSAQGFPCYALSFRGHGESEGREKLHTYTLEDYVDDVLQILPRLPQRPIVIGHSMGGAIIQKLLEKQPDIVHAAVLMSSVPPEGFGKDVFRLLFRHFAATIQMFFYNKDRDATFLARLFLARDMSADKKKAFIPLLQPESLKARQEMNGQIILPSTRTDLPMLVLGSQEDQMVSVASICATARRFSTEPVIFAQISHDMMLDPRWQEVAAQILAYLQKAALVNEEGA